jgi:hypothetical protein
LQGLNNPEDIQRRKDLVRRAQREEDDGEFLSGVFGLCRQACNKLDGANSSLGDAYTMLEEMDKGIAKGNEDFHLRDLLKAMSIAQSRISSIIQAFQKLEGRAGRQREDDKKRLDNATELLRQACIKMGEASVTIGEAHKLAEVTHKRAQIGTGARVALSRRLRSRDFLKTISGIRGSLSRIVRTARTTANLQEEAVREVINSRSAFE